MSSDVEPAHWDRPHAVQVAQERNEKRFTKAARYERRLMMNARSKLWLATTVLGTAMLGMIGNASAKSVWAMLTDQNGNTPNGVTYKTCGGLIVWGETRGFDSNGNTVCGARSESNGSFIQYNGCLTTGVTYQATVRTSSATLCSGPRNNWGGTISACHTGPVVLWSSQLGCSTIDLGVWGRGII
jgi:hypothetical protein